LHLVFAFAAMLWTVGVLAAPHWFSLPIALFMLPLFVFFVVKALFGPLLYARRVRCSVSDIAGSALAGMALSHAIARGVFSGLAFRRAVFEITRKASGNDAKAAAARPALPVREEAFLFAGLVTCAIGVLLTQPERQLEATMWTTILLLQSLPYAAALTCNALSRVPERVPASATAGATAALPAASVAAVVPGLASAGAGAFAPAPASAGALGLAPVTAGTLHQTSGDAS